jgi:hypothetical protein
MRRRPPTRHLLPLAATSALIAAGVAAGCGREGAEHGPATTARPFALRLAEVGPSLLGTDAPALEDACRGADQVVPGERPSAEQRRGLQVAMLRRAADMAAALARVDQPDRKILVGLQQPRSVRDALEESVAELDERDCAPAAARALHRALGIR